MFDFHNNIERIKENFLKSKTTHKDKYKRPSWMNNDDALSQIYIDIPKLYQSGQIVYANIVQANVILFRNFPQVNCPANIVFSTDDYYKSNPKALYDISRMLYHYKNKNNAPPELKQITNSITGEMERLLNIPIPLSITGNRQVYFTTIMVHRNHLPKRRLISSIFPLICDPNKLSTSVILPKKYWTKEFKWLYINK